MRETMEDTVDIRLAPRHDAGQSPRIVAHPEMDADLLWHVRPELVAMDADPAGRDALEGVSFDGFFVPERRLYDSIRAMAAERDWP